MNKMIRIVLLSSLCVLSFSVNATNVLVSHPITAGVAKLLLKDSGIDIVSATPEKTPAPRQLHYLESKGKAALAEFSQQADAVITVKSLYGKDFVYPLARRHNINLVAIDIAQPIDGKQPGVATLDLAEINEHQAWLNPTSLQTMMVIFSDEVKRLKQTDMAMAKVIDSNLDKQQRRLRELTNRMEETLDAAVNEPVALILNPELSYFAQGLQIQSYQTERRKITDAELLQLIETRDINLIITNKKLSESQRKLLEEEHVPILKIKRLKATDPITQLDKTYAELERLLKEH